MIRLRIHYSKGREQRYTGTLDMQKSWERAFRRAGLRLAYSQGFHPQPKLQMACPLPLGFTSSAELVEVWLDEEAQPAGLQETIQANLIPGLHITRIEEVPLNASAIQATSSAARYVIDLQDQAEAVMLQTRVDGLLAAAEVIRTWKGKSYDLRPRILALGLRENPTRLIMELSARESATGRPEEVLSELGLDPTAVRVERSALITLEGETQILYGAEE